MTTPQQQMNAQQRKILANVGTTFGRPWKNGLQLTSEHLGCKKLGKDHLPQINQVVGLTRELTELGLLEARRSKEGGIFDWDVRITDEGKRYVKGNSGGRGLGALGAVLAVTACTTIATTEKTADIPPAVQRPGFTAPEMVQIRDVTGRNYWTYCQENCPKPTPKKLAGAEQPAMQSVKVAEAVKPVAQQVAATTPTMTTEMQKRSYSVFFKIGTSKLTAEGKEALEDLGPDLLRAENVVIVGRADPKGSVELNKGLSKSRAEVVKHELAKVGVDPEKVDVVTRIEEAQLGRGTRPLGTEPDTIAAQSRRADVSFSLLVLKRK